IANTVTSVCNLMLLLYALRRKLGKLELEPLRATVLPLLVAGVVAAAIAWWGGRYWEQTFGHANLALRFGAVFAPAVVAGGAYCLVAMALKVPAAKELFSFAFQKLRR